MKKILICAFCVTVGYASHAQSKGSSKPEKTIIKEVTLTPPPQTDDMIKDGSAMAGMMNNFGPMMGNMVKSMMDAQLDYFKQPGKMEEIAKLQKQYFDALIKEGFNTDQALKIITSDSILPKSNGK